MSFGQNKTKELMDKDNIMGTKKKSIEPVLTKEQLARRINNAVVMVNKTKDYIGVYFADKGLRLECSDDCAIISTLYHRHVFNMVTSSGISKPYVFISRVIDFALTNDCTVVDADGNTTRSWAKLFDVLKAKADNTEYNILWYVDIWLQTIFAPLYSISENTADSFFVYERYMHEIACTHVLMQGIEHQEESALTNTDFVNKVLELEKSFLEGIAPTEILAKKSKEETIKENADALDDIENDNLIVKMNKG